jgi:hypothetical protein
MISNPAVEDLLKELGVVPSDFINFPSRQTVTRKLDTILEADDKKYLAIFKALLLSGVRISLSWDEWESAKKVAFLCLSLHAILPDFSQTIDIPIAVSEFPFPHNGPDYREKVIDCFIQRTAFTRDQFKRHVQGLASDGAAVNRCFSPDPDVLGLSREDRTERRRVCKEFELNEEFICICHRLVKMEEHVLFDDKSDASNLFLSDVEAVFAVGSVIRVSGKNRQELARVQSIDPVRAEKKMRIVQDYRCTTTRWSYNEGRLARNIYLWDFYKQLDMENTSMNDTVSLRNNWNRLLLDGSESIERLVIVHPIMARISRWLRIFQSRWHPIVSLILYMVSDLTKVADIIGEHADALGEDGSESIASRFVAEIESEFHDDVSSEYLHIAQLFDPRVMALTTPREGQTLAARMEELLDKAKVFILRVDPIEAQEIVVAANDDSNDGFGEIEARNTAYVPDPHQIGPDAQYEKDKLYFLTSIRKSVKKKVMKEGEAVVEFFGGVNRAVDINVHDFYSHHGSAIPELIKVIASVLGSRCVSTTPEITFSTGGFVYSDYRQSLLPSRAEGIILSTCRYKLEKAKVAIPAIPDIGVVDKEAVLEEAEAEPEPPIALAANPDQLRRLEEGFLVPELDGYDDDSAFLDLVEEDGE